MSQHSNSLTNTELPVNYSCVGSVFSNDVFLSKAKSDQGASRSHTDLFHAGMDILTSPFMAINIIFKKKRHICNIEVRNQAFGKTLLYVHSYHRSYSGKMQKEIVPL